MSGKTDCFLIHLDSFYNLEGGQVNLGILYIGAALKEKGFSVKVMSTADLFYLSNRHLMMIFRQYSPRLVGFYTMSDTIFQTAHLARHIRQWLPGAKFVAGGPLASAVGAGLLRYFPFDYIFKGEGERVMPELLSRIKKGETAMADIPGLIINNGDSVTQGPPPQPIMDLDSLPNPDRDLVDRTLRLNISAGRGCPNACTFCFQAVHGKGYRFRSAANVASEIIENLEKYNYRAFDIIDDTFVADASRAFEFCRIMKEYREKSKRDYAWYCEARVDTLAIHPDLLNAMIDAGLIRLQVGIESGDPMTLKRYGKRLDLAKLEELCANVEKLGVNSIFGNFIIGGPYETKETLARSLDLAIRLHRTAPGLFESTSGFLVPFPETPLSKFPERFGISYDDSEFLTSLTLDECLCETKDMTRADIRRARYEFTEKLNSEMLKLIPKMPRDRILRHYHWMRRYGTQTRWLTIFRALPAIDAYFKYYDSPKFGTLDKMPMDRLNTWTPLRTIGPLQYDKRNWEDFRLTMSWKDLKLTDPVEKEIYALSAGKLNMQELCEALCQRLNLAESPAEAFSNKIIPVMKKLEKHFQVIFHES